MYEQTQAKCDGFIEGDLCINKNDCLRYNRKQDDLFQEWVTPKLSDIGKCSLYIKDYSNEQTHKRK